MNIPTNVLEYAKRIARNGSRPIFYITKQEVERLKVTADKAVAEYESAKREFETVDKEQEDAKEWLTSLGIEIDSPETCSNDNF